MIPKPRLTLLSLLCLIIAGCSSGKPAEQTSSDFGQNTKTVMDAERTAVVRIVDAPPTTTPNPFYISNRPPLAPSPFAKLPIGAITPKGWLRNQLDLSAKGMVGRLPEVSQWCKFENNAWVVAENKGHSGWEELPYWLKGYGDLGYVLKDEKIIAEAKKWIDAIMATQREDGYFGPRVSLTSLDGKPDQWPNMLALNVLQSWQEHSGDKRVIPFMTKYFKWQMSVPEKDFLVGYWPKMRGGDNLESVYWLYNRTGEAWLLELAAKIHRNTAAWEKAQLGNLQTIPNFHNVNLAQGFREPAEFWMQSRDDKHLRGTHNVYDTIMGEFGQFPGGGFAGDENCRRGYVDPRQGFETCGITEFMHSFEMLTRITGDPLWADRCEDIAFNSFPASVMPDFKGLHYLTCANQVQLDRNNKAPGIENGGTMFSYSPYAAYRCCQHNVSHGWPYYAEEMWLATADAGVCAMLYAESEVSAKVGDGRTVKITEQTDYPFSDQIRFTINTAGPAKFPLYLRVPKWCQSPQVLINGRDYTAPARPLAYLVLDRAWADGDVVTLTLPMSLSIRKWAKNGNSISVDRGPLTYSLQIGEKWNRYGGNDAWPEQELLATTPWNYGLIVDEGAPQKSIDIVQKPGPLAAQPFTPQDAPISLKARAKRIPGWTKETTGLVRTLQHSPAKSDAPVETVTLIPMGAARLRISAFPVIGEGSDAIIWRAPPVTPTASHTFGNDTINALNDGVLPKDSNDHSVPRFTWWDHKGSEEWVQYEFDRPRKVTSVSLYWFDDAPINGGCRVPKSWQVQYKSGEEWKSVGNPGAFETAANQLNSVKFDGVETTAVRLLVQLQPGYSAGILEWKVE